MLGNALSKRATATEVLVEGRPLRLTNLGKIWYPAVGFRKADAIAYYARIAPTLLPYLRGRPMTLKRYPEGVDGPHFYDKHCRGAPPWLPVAPVWSERQRKDIQFCRLDDQASLLWSVNYANLEMHPLLSVAPDHDTPTALVFDLDPGPPAGILHAAEIALILHELLAGIKLESRVKSSGSNGVQLYVPLNVPVTFDRTKAFARQIAELLAGRLPERVVARSDRRLREGRVLIDWGQNDRHKSTVAAYSLRAKREFPTVSAPVTWDALAAAVDRGDESALLPGPHDVLERVSDDGDPFRDVLSLAQQLPT
jgi:bifunctional non-homologous end joining protein LigD